MDPRVHRTLVVAGWLCVGAALYGGVARYGLPGPMAGVGLGVVLGIILCGMAPRRDARSILEVFGVLLLSMAGLLLEKRYGSAPFIGLALGTAIVFLLLKRPSGGANQSG
jgi:hypothetical protein